MKDELDSSFILHPSSFPALHSLATPLFSLRSPDPCGTEAPSLMKVVRGLIALVLTAALVGCSGITVRRAGAPHLFDAWQASAGLAGELSPRSLLTLRRLD